jgi:exopolyphosphatase/pppGpp-phosphohydrolase
MEARNNSQPPEPGESDSTALYRALRGGVAAGQAIVALHIGACQTTLAAGTGSEPAATLVLEIGTQKTSDDCFKHQPPTPLELENAIMIVEDELARARAMSGEGVLLLTRGAALSAIARFCGVAEQPAVSLAVGAVEGAFGRLAAIAEGVPAAAAGLPAGRAGNELAATLLIVRELMHHLKFAEITVVV